MSTEQEQQPNNADAEIMRLATEAEPEESDGELELGGEEAPEAKPEDVDAEAEKKPRSRPWQQRVDILTARLREAERRAADAEAKAGGKQEPEAEKAPDPNDDKYEFGEADPQFIRDMARHEARQEIAELRKKEREEDSANAEKAEFYGKINEGVSNVEKQGAEKYEDFEEKLEAAVEARGGEPLPPLVSIGIAVSPAGADIAYKLATDEAASAKIERLAKANPQAAAIAFGELEGEFLDGDDEDLNPADPLDMARMVGRMRARLRGGKQPDAEAIERRITKAPKPADQRARGASGQFEVSDDTEDFAAFERKIMGGKKS